jgi:hypothetical protein
MTTATRSLLHNYSLDDGGSVTLCREHSSILGDRIVSKDEPVSGGKWKCTVCTVNRKLGGDDIAWSVEELEDTVTV